jgi:hypothetical protein
MSANKMYHFEASSSGALFYIPDGNGKEIKLDFSNGHCAVVLSAEELAEVKKYRSYGGAFALQGKLKNPASGHQVQVIISKGASPGAPPPSTSLETNLTDAEELEEQRAETARIQMALAQQEAEEKARNKKP